MTEPLRDAADLPTSGTFVLGFFGTFSATATAARPAFDAFAATADVPVYAVDVAEVKGVHPRFDVTSVPTAITVADGRVIRRASGSHDAEGWSRALLPHESDAVAGDETGPRFPAVTVYSTPTCSWCTRLKRYLDGAGVPYRDVDVAADPAIAQELVRRSGQQGVPQTDIAGQIIVGFDKPRIDRLLGLAA